MGSFKECPLGHGVVLDKHPMKYHDGTIKYYDWGKTFFQIRDEQFQFLFSALWVKYDNTKEGFISRLKYLLDNYGVLPSNWLKMIRDWKLFYQKK